MKKILSYSLDSGQTYIENTEGLKMHDFKQLKDHKTLIRYVLLFEDNYFESRLHFVNYCMKVIREKFNEKLYEGKTIFRYLHSIYNEGIINSDIYFHNNLNLPHLYFSFYLKKTQNLVEFQKLLEDVLSAVESLTGKDNNSNYTLLLGESHTATIEKIEIKPTLINWDDTGVLLTEEVKKLTQKQAGIYKLYNSSKELIYIGMSHNLLKRIVSSIRDKGAFYVSFIICHTLADASIIEPYLISIHRPILNTQYMTDDKPTFEIPIPEETELFETGVEEKYIELASKRYLGANE